MEPRPNKVPDKVNEQYILPILFLLVNITIVLWFYVIHEYSQSHEAFKIYYRFDDAAIASYTRELKFQIILFSAVLLVTPLYLKYKKRWLLVSLTLIHSVVLYYFFYLK
ncbi:MAG: hypothetical protein AAF765_16250 [Bacteroidota bacterium]